ncbi:hypothetical protein VTJ83DRAFT_1604 [Remersonia thermophila]|uniref:RING-type E3 ubiquitin transferase n=1 Tax=Remersonia thermophila TaxID=72144 RepID=A0ABR4DGE3_9PEZI
MRPPRIAILVFFALTALLLVYRAISANRLSDASGIPPASPVKKASAGSTLSWTTPFSILFPPNAAISLTDDNATFFPARPAAFGPPLPSEGLSGQLWVGSTFSDDVFHEGEGDGELGCSDIPGWTDERTGLGIKTVAESMRGVETSPLALSAKGPRLHPLDKEPALGRRLAPDKLSKSKPKVVDDGTDDHLFQGYQETSSSFSDRPAGSDATHADIQSMQETAEIKGKIVLISRGGCGFLDKVKWAQRRGAIALIVGDNQKGGPLIQMFAKGNAENVTIPSVFTTRTTAHLLSSLSHPSGRIEGVSGATAEALRKIQQQTTKPKSAKNPKKQIPSARRTAKTLNPGDASSQLKRSSPSDKSRKSWLFGWGDGQGASSNAHTRPLDDEVAELGRDGLVGTTQEIGKNSAKGAGATSADGRSSDAPTDRLGTSVKATDKSASKFANFRGDRKPAGGSAAPQTGAYEPAADDNFVKGHGKSQVSGSNRGSSSGSFGSSQGSGEESKDTIHETQSFSTSTSASEYADPEDDEEEVVREGLWVTITPTGSASPFLDTLVILVISPLVTLSVVYALLILRVKIRMRRWRAPKSVIDRLPVRTYHTVPSSSSSSSRTPTPRSASPTTPLLQDAPGSRAADDGSRGRRGTETASRPARRQSPEKTSRGGTSQWKKYMGRQVECVVCLEEYVDGVSQVMSLPCGHEFHVECITPWLTTRRRTCPICKSDVVRSLARAGNSSEPTYEPFREDADESNGESPDSFEDPRGFFSPNQADDLERGPSFTRGSGHNWPAQAGRSDAFLGPLASRLTRFTSGGSSSRSWQDQGSSGERGR